MTFLEKIEKTILKFILKHRRLHIVTGILNKKDKAGGITQPHFKTYYKTIVIKIVWHWHKKGDRDQ